ncbi:MAG TPA: hypothetical protein VIM65_02495 [Cyclobacteriaceae bacterium]
MRFLLLSSLVAVSLLIGCKSEYADLKPVQADVTCIEKFKPPFQTQWYNTSIDVIGKHISGLLLFKAMPDSSLRVVFTNEVGITLLDFGFSNDGKFKVYQVIKLLDKKAVINLLRKDFDLIMMRNLRGANLKSFTRNGEIFMARTGKSETDYFITDKDCASLLRIEKASKKKLKTMVTRIGGEQIPDSVFLKHYTFNMTIALKKLKR